MFRYLVVLLFLVTLSFGQQKEQRYVIYDLGKVGDSVTKVLLDTQTGRTWILTKDSSIDKLFPVWSELLYVRVPEISGNDTLTVSNYPKPYIKQKK